MDISMGLDNKSLDPHASEKQGSFTIEAASSSEDVDMAAPSAVSLNQSPPTTTTTITTLKGAKNNIMLGATPIPLSMNTENNSLHHFQTNAANPTMYTAPSVNSAYVHAALGPLPTGSIATVPSSATADFMALHGHTIGVFESPRRNSVPTLTADHKRKVSSEEKTLHRQASWSNFSSMATHPMSSLSTTTSLPNLHQIDTATHVDPNMVQYYRSPFSQQQVLQQTPHHTLNKALPPSATSSACPSPMPESLMQGSVLNSINSSPITGVAGNKKINRSESHTVTLKSQSKRGAKGAGGAERRRRGTSRPLEGRRRSNTDDDTVKQETQDNDELQPVLSSQNPEGALSMHHNHHHHAIHGYGSGSMHHDGDEYSPTRSPGGTPTGHPSGMSEDEPFGMINHSGYSTFANNTLYSMGDPMEHLSGMATRFDTIRLDLKSVAPSDIHKPSSTYDDESSGSGNPNGESPHPSPMPHYEHFAFPTSISTHFMPILNSSFSMDHPGLHHHQHALHHHPSSGGPDSASSSSYSSLPSADSSASSASSFHHHNHHGYHPEGYQFGANGLHSMGSDLHYPPASPMNEDGSMNHHHPHHHPHPLHPQSFHHSHQHHSDFYDSKVANPQMLHHPFPSLQHPSASALPPHPLMSTSPFTAPGGLNEPLYSSTSSTSSSSSLPGSRATTTPDIINSKGSTTSTKSNSSSSSSSTTSSTNGASTSTNTNTGSGSGSGGGGSKHGGSGKHHTCSEIGCSKRFKRLEHLKRHIKTHTLERPFNCPYTTCTKKFSRSDNLSQHVKTHQRQLSKLQMKQRNQAQAQAQQQQAQQQAVHG
ncbi:hypothetical protein BGW39_008494 [Mortierella sp. 14UC]|nr:hypothetical protein BGW39_008494 [Mortierella sp. 14UC]